MKRIIGFLVGIGLVAVQAQETNSVEQLQQQLREMRERFERVQQEQRQQIDDLTRKVEELTRSKGAADTNDLVKQLAAELGTNQPAAAGSAGKAPPAPWSPAEPLTVARAGSSYMNISFDTVMDGGWSSAREPSDYLQLGDHDPIKRGFSLPNAEIALDGAVDPYFRGFANVLLKLDANNETSVELEETYLQTISLPANLQAKGGQFLANFGRQNTQHPHQWGFVDLPVILTRTFGPEGLRNPGVQGSWLAPTPFYTEAFLGVFDGRGSSAFSFRNTDPVHGRESTDRQLRGFGDLLYVPRLASSFDLSDSQTLLAGVSAALGPNNTGTGAYSQVYGVDWYWKWKPARARGGFPFVSWQTEFLWQRFEAGEDVAAGLPAETLRDWGFYSQVLWGFQPRWVAGLRGDYADGNSAAADAGDVFRGRRTRVSPNLTFYPSEFSKLRLQYNYDHGELFGEDHSVWLQVEFLLGAHGAHKF